MNQKLLDNNYIIIPNFISNYRANKLKDEFVEYSQQNNLEEILKFQLLPLIIITFHFWNFCVKKHQKYLKY